MQAIEKPDKITVSPDDGTPPSCAFDFVVSMLKHEHSLLFWEEGDRHSLFDMSIRPTTAQRS